MTGLPIAHGVIGLEAARGVPEDPPQPRLQTRTRWQAPGPVHQLPARAGADTITIDHAVAWVGLPAGGRGWLAFRMSVLRGFPGYLHTLDPAVPMPPADLFPSGPHRAVPYLYSEDELAAWSRPRIRCATRCNERPTAR